MRLTPEEKIAKEREKLLKAIWIAVGIWGNPSTNKKQDPRDKAVGLAFYILYVLDGKHKTLPKYKLVVDDESIPPTNIAGSLSAEFRELDPMIELRRILNERIE